MVEEQSDMTVKIPEKQHTYPFSFTGKAGEFFGIWFVNILLTIITLGIYSAWAKVRQQQYFYNHTHLADANFQYTAKPIKILIGRIIAVVLFMAFSFASSIDPILSLVLLAVFFFAMPWLVNSSLRFNAYNSAYRNIRLGFTGTYPQALLKLVVLPMLPAVVLLGSIFGGLYLTGNSPAMMFPSANDTNFAELQQELERQQLESELNLEEDPLSSLNIEQDGEQEIFLGDEATPFNAGEMENAPIFFAIVFIAAIFSVFLAVFSFHRQLQYVVSNHKFGNEYFKFEGGMAKIFIIFLIVAAIYIGLFIAMGIIIGGISALLPAFAMIVAPILSSVLSIFIMVFAVAYVNSAMRNYTFSNSLLGDDFKFESTLSVWTLFKTYVLGAFLMIITLGLMYPWFKIKLATIHAEATTISGDKDMDTFLADKSSESSNAVGEELAEVFDVGISI